MSYYPRIRDLREDSDKKQTELAEYLGTTAQYYGLYEKGTSEIPFERAILLAKYYNVSLDYIVGLTNNKKGLSCGDIKPEQQRLLDTIEKLSPEQRKIATALLESLINAIK